MPTFAPFHTQSVRIFAVVRKTSNKFPDFLDSFMRISKYYTANYLSFRRHVHKILSELRKIQQHFKGRCIFQKPPENFDFSKSARKIGSASREFGSFSPPEKRALPIEYIHAQVSREDEAGNVRQDHLNRLPVVYLDRPATPYSKSSTRFSGYQANFRETEEASGSSLSKCPLCCDIIVLLEPFSNI